MLEYLPDSPTARRGLAYHQLMAAENVPKAAEIALAEHKKSANKRATCRLAALAMLSLGEIAQADALYDALPLQKNAPAANKAIRVAILWKMNRPEEAEALAATINQAQLSPEERRLLALERPLPDLEGATKPLEGATKPLEGATKPLEGATEPLEGATEPLEGATKPLEEATKPLEGATKPLEEATEPLEGATKPLEGATKPLEGATKPLESWNSVWVGTNCG
jgi:exonuclease VII small subunit